jgi:phage terminase large subunit GpA-like protein
MPNPETRPATTAEIAAFERGEQKTWRCPGCGETTELLGALMVWCSYCQEEKGKLVSMKEVADA